MASAEARYLQNEIFFRNEESNVEQYFFNQMVNYAKDLKRKGIKIEDRVKRDFNQNDWNLNQAAREWTHRSHTITIKLEKHESTLSSVLKDKLIHFYVSS